MPALERTVWIILIVALIGNIGLWLLTKNYKSKWANVPPAPTKLAASGAGLGDSTFAYRSYGIMLQNMGDSGGRVTSLRDYNYDNISDWFMLLHSFDQTSNFVPYIASYYYGGLDKHTERLNPLVDYLAIAGNSTEGEKWRWLAQAAYLARFKVEDLDRALELARQLAVLDNPKIPGWAKHMEANVLNARGEKEASYQLLVSILRDKGDQMPIAEVNATRAYICEQILTPEQVKENPLCEGEF